MSYPQAEKEPAAPACQGPQPLSFSVVVACNDDRVLQAALDMSDVFRLLMEKVIGDAADRARTEQLNEGNKASN
jgi:hypothetical protein